jgi:hypothetical protein
VFTSPWEQFLKALLAVLLVPGTVNSGLLVCLLVPGISFSRPS